MSEIRYMQQDDAFRVAEIQVNAWKTVYVGIVPQAVLDRASHSERLEAWERIINESTGSKSIVIVDSEITGWASYGVCRDEDKDRGVTQELWAIYVDPTRLRSGYGQKLLSGAMREMLEKEPEEITLWVLEENHSAIAFYESTGFVLDGMKKLPEKLEGAVEVRMVLKIEKVV